MREIKFRAWDGERIKDVTSIGWIDGDLDYVSTPKISSPADDFILMQYTGLKDKNGKEIYEFDHLRHTNEEATDEVSTVPPLTLEHFDDYQGLFDSEWFDGEKYTNVEVVGNEYEGDI